MQSNMANTTNNTTEIRIFVLSIHILYFILFYTKHCLFFDFVCILFYLYNLNIYNAYFLHANVMIY